MRSKKKIIVGAIVVLVLVNVVVFSLLLVSSKRQAETKLVPDQQEETKNGKVKSDLIQVRIENIESSEVEYEVIMDGLDMVKEENRKSEKAKLADDAEIFVKCEVLALDDWAKAVAESEDGSLQEENGEGQNYSNPREPDEKCQGAIENLVIGSLVGMKLKEGKITYISN